eukprot:3369228-Pleurochrysis_carterae.AAC.1
MDQWPPWECAQNAASNDLRAGSADLNANLNTENGELEDGSSKSISSAGSNVATIAITYSIVIGLLAAVAFAVCCCTSKGRISCFPSRVTVRMVKSADVAPAKTVKPGEAHQGAPVASVEQLSIETHQWMSSDLVTSRQVYTIVAQIVRGEHGEFLAPKSMDQELILIDLVGADIKTADVHLFDSWLALNQIAQLPAAGTTIAELTINAGQLFRRDHKVIFLVQSESTHTGNGAERRRILATCINILRKESERAHHSGDDAASRATRP